MGGDRRSKSSVGSLGEQARRRANGQHARSPQMIRLLLQLDSPRMEAASSRRGCSPRPRGTPRDPLFHHVLQTSASLVCTGPVHPAASAHAVQAARLVPANPPHDLISYWSARDFPACRALATPFCAVEAIVRTPVGRYGSRTGPAGTGKGWQDHETEQVARCRTLAASGPRGDSVRDKCTLGRRLARQRRRADIWAPSSTIPTSSASDNSHAAQIRAGWRDSTHGAATSDHGTRSPH